MALACQDDATISGIPVLVQFTGDPRPLMQALRQEVRTLDSRLLVTPETLASIIAQEADRYRTIVALTALPSGLAVFLALVGVYRRHVVRSGAAPAEVGIRIALGARPHEIVGLFLRSLQWPLLAGLLVGLPLAALSATLLQRSKLLFGIAPLDPWIFGGATMLVALVAGVATSSLVAAYLNDRRFCGTELDERYFALAGSRIVRKYGG
jgi:putative ABC transport system permease protein